MDKTKSNTISVKQKIQEAEKAISKLAKKGSEDNKLSPFEVMMNIIRDSHCQIYLDQFREPHITVPTSPSVGFAIDSDMFKNWMSAQYYATAGMGVTDSNYKMVVNTLHGQAHHEKIIRYLHLRTAKMQNTIYYDLGDDVHVIKIDADGWQSIENAPVTFRRFNHHKEQVLPSSQGDLERVFKYINISSELDKLLFLSYLVAVLIPTIPRCLLALTGPAGSAKSTSMKIVRGLIDPSEIPLLHLHGNKHNEIFIHAYEHYCLFYDNLSYLKYDTSDLFCELVTGISDSRRKLYSNRDSLLIKAKSALGITGIGLVAERPDLLERSLIFNLDKISERYDEEFLDAEYEKDKPLILGGLFDLLSKTLANIHSVSLSYRPRMSDFAKYGASAAVALGYSSEQYILAYKQNQQRQNKAAIDGSFVAQTLIEFVSTRGSWKGSSTTLYVELRTIAIRMGVQIGRGGFPAAANALWKAIVPIKETLQQIGIVIEKRPAPLNQYSEIEITQVNLPQYIEVRKQGK